MNVSLAAILIIFAVQAFAGGTSEEVTLLSLSETKEDEYTIKYRSVESNKVFTIYLSYRKLGYMFKARFLTQDKYADAIKLLEEQLKHNKNVRFGWFGGGPCVVDKINNVYRSDALDIYTEDYPNRGSQVVYAFCEYK